MHCLGPPCVTAVPASPQPHSSHIHTQGTTRKSRYDAALELVDSCRHSIAYSYFPRSRFPWSSVVQAEVLQTAVMLACYGVAAFAAGSLVVRRVWGTVAALLVTSRVRVALTSPPPWS